MKIISKFTDYYDKCMKRVNDDEFDNVWNRKRKHVPVRAEVVKYFEDNKFYMFNALHFQIYIIIAGKVVPMIYVEKHDSITNTTDVYMLYSKKEVRDYFPIKEWDIEQLDKFFGPYPDMLKLCIDLGTPLILISTGDDFYDTKTNISGVETDIRYVYVNPNLSDFQFNRIMSAEDIYKKLEHFVENVLPNKEKEDN